MSIDQYSTTPSNNDLTNYFKTGMRPSAVKNAGWDVMADIASYLVSLPTAGGTANALIVANGRPFGALVPGLLQILNPASANTGAATFAPDGLTAKNIFYLGKALVSGELQASIPVILKYDGTQWNLFNSYRGLSADFYADTGSVNALVATANSAVLLGAKIRIKVANTNTTNSATLNVNGVGGVTIYSDVSFSTPCPAGSLAANGIYEFISYGGSGWVCINPSRSTGTFSGTINPGLTTTPSVTTNYAIGTNGKDLDVWWTTAVTGTGNTLTMGLTSVPAALQCTTNKRTPYFPIEDSSSVLAVFINNTNTATWQFTTNLSGNGLTASATKGIITAGFHIVLD